jgi:hypothetical protein
MATCPRCMGPLTEHHQCPHGIIRRVTQAVWIVGAGAIVGGLSTWAVSDGPPPALVLAAAALGAVLAGAVKGAVGGRKS